MVKGELPHKDYYIVPDVSPLQHGGADITVVSPTQQAVDQAKMAIKRKLEELPKPLKRRKINVNKKTEVPQKTIKSKSKTTKPQSKTKRPTVQTNKQKAKSNKSKKPKKTIKSKPKVKKPQSEVKRSSVKTSGAQTLKYYR